MAHVQVLEEEEYHRRKGYYLDSLQRHYYFMNVGNGEVIDACRKVMHTCITLLTPMHFAPQTIPLYYIPCCLHLAQQGIRNTRVSTLPVSSRTAVVRPLCSDAGNHFWLN